MEKVEKSPIDKIDLAELISVHQVTDIETFKKYIIEIWSDLSRRSKNPQKGITKITFAKYYDLPGIILERLFSVFDTKNDSLLDHEEFFYGMKLLFCQGESFQSLANFIFNFYDFDKDGKIDKEDVRVVLSYIPFQSKLDYKYTSTIENNFQDRIESQDQLYQIINTAFQDKKRLTLTDYQKIVENISSDIFILVLMFLLENKPFNAETIRIFNKNKAINPNILISKTPKILPQIIASPSLNSKFVSPSLKRKTFLQVNKNKNKQILNLYAGGDENKNKEDGLLTLFKINEKEKEKEIKIGDKKTKEKEKEKGKEKEKEKEKERKKPQRRGRMKDLLENQDPLKSDKNFVKHFEQKDIDKNYINSEQKIIEEDENFGLYEETKPIEQEGYIFKFSEKGDLKRVYFHLVGKDLYFYKDKDDNTHKGIHNLSDVFIKEGEPKKIEGKIYYSLFLVFPQKDREYFFDKESDFKLWKEKLQTAVNYRSFLEKYEVKETVGRGKFGLIKAGFNKTTKEKVAIKIMSKTHMDNTDLELARTEIDILKISQHPNIIKLFDTYETIDYIYIILEFCGGKDLFAYLDERNYKLSEPRSCEIIHKLSMAVYYLHSYGIIHRDLKPENILMTDKTDNADIRLMDFGLSKITGPYEKCKEPYGTISFVAPEVLKGKEYDKSVDLWSIGIITFLLLCGYLPFDDRKSEKEIVRQTIYDPVPFMEDIWSGLSPEAKDFVDGLLQKEPYKRFTIEQVLEHPWIKKFSKVPDSRKGNKTGSKFRDYVSN